MQLSVEVPRRGHPILLPEQADELGAVRGSGHLRTTVLPGAEEDLSTHRPRDARGPGKESCSPRNCPKMQKAICGHVTSRRSMEEDVSGMAGSAQDLVARQQPFLVSG